MTEVRAVLRRSGAPVDAPRTLMHFGHEEIDEAAREARIDGVDMRLRPR